MQADSIPVVWPAPYSLFWVTLGRLSVAAVAVVVVGVSAWLAPSPTGVGTHSMLGMPPCAFHAATGLPCPSCGMTTSFACMAHLDVAAALDAQPFGAAMFITILAGGVVAFWCAVFNKSMLAIAARIFTKRIGLMIVVAFLLTWVFQIIKTLLLR